VSARYLEPGSIWLMVLGIVALVATIVLIALIFAADA
jgi:uncharacterized membrane protein